MTTINSIEEFLTQLEKDHVSNEGELWFRGQSNANWKLLPGYLRLQNPLSQSTLLKKFKQSAALLLDRDPGGKNDYPWMFLMQHYGLPTRLLDWSESPLVGLYFSVEHDDVDEKDVDAALWVLNPTKLNHNAHIHDPAEKNYIPSFDDEELSNYSFESTDRGSKRTQMLPIATIATRNNPRIQAQLGVFTIHHLDPRPIEDIGDKTHITKYVIPASAKIKIKKQLRVLGFSEFTLFPELASIGEKIMREIK